MFELIVLIATIYYFYHDYQKAKLEGMTLDGYIRSYARGIVIAIVILLFVSVLFGCSSDTPQAEADEWLIAEQVSYNENDEPEMRMVYTHETPYNYQITSYNGDKQINHIDVTISKDGKLKTEKNYNQDQLIQMTETVYDKDGKELSKTMTLENIHTMPGESAAQKTEYHWSKDGKTAEVIIDGEYQLTREYDEQGRILRNYNADYETVYTYGEQEMILRTSYTNRATVEYVVHQYDAQGRELETLNYHVDTDRVYSKDDIIAHTMFEYKDDGHSYRMTFVYDDGEVSTKGSTEFIYKPLSELLQK